jgi:rhodanese-related sulfurtransferase
VARFLQQQGYRARALTGGYDAWKQAGLPLTRPVG